MKIFGQPESYSDILQRVFYMTVATGVICTFLLVNASPTFQKFMDSISTEADIGPVKNLKILYVLLPLLLGIFSRMIRMHDRISDLLRIRHIFDTRYLLFPLAQGTDIPLTNNLKKKIIKDRVNLMDKVFYPFARFRNPIIEEQLVRTAADNWGWFWVFIESSVLIILTMVILALIQQWNYVYICLVALLI